MYRLFQCLISACKLTSRCSIPHSTCFSLEGGGAVAEKSSRFELAISRSRVRVLLYVYVNVLGNAHARNFYGGRY